MVLLPSEHMPDLNRHDTTDYMRAPAGEGDGYVASLEVFHQLHCLVSDVFHSILDSIDLSLDDRITYDNLPGIKWAHITKITHNTW